MSDRARDLPVARVTPTEEVLRLDGVEGRIWTAVSARGTVFGLHVHRVFVEAQYADAFADEFSAVAVERPAPAVIMSPADRARAVMVALGADDFAGSAKFRGAIARAIADAVDAERPAIEGAGVRRASALVATELRQLAAASEASSGCLTLAQLALFAEVIEDRLDLAARALL